MRSGHRHAHGDQQVRTQEEKAGCEPRRENLERTSPAHTWISDIRPLELWGTPLGLRGAAAAALAGNAGSQGIPLRARMCVPGATNASSSRQLAGASALGSCASSGRHSPGVRGLRFSASQTHEPAAGAALPALLTLPQGRFSFTTACLRAGAGSTFPGSQG